MDRSIRYVTNAVVVVAGVSAIVGWAQRYGVSATARTVLAVSMLGLLYLGVVSLMRLTLFKERGYTWRSVWRWPMVLTVPMASATNLLAFTAPSAYLAVCGFMAGTWLTRGLIRVSRHYPARRPVNA